MAGKLDDISEAIGALRAETRASTFQRAEISAKVDRVIAATANLPVLVERLDRIEPIVVKLNNESNRNKGAIAVVGGMIGAGVTAAAAAIARKLGL